MSDQYAQFIEWLHNQHDYPTIDEGTTERIYLRANEARELLFRSFTAGYTFANPQPVDSR